MKQERHKRQRDSEDEDVDSTQDVQVPRNRPIDGSAVGSSAEKSEYGYQNGSIMKVTMKSFVTYEYCSFTPGPNLNMIIGPNGTGKSTIVCALALGLGWNTNLLGRAKDVSEFVKHGSDKGWIEIVLCSKQGQNCVIKRHINKSNNTSIWKINGENKSQKDVIKKVQSFNIQIDNLCQFLPQDRVSEFAQMSPQELLRETQRAVGGDDMVKSHDRMIELWNEHKNVTASMKGDLTDIATNEKRNAVIEKDVLRFQQREAVLRRHKLLAIWILYAKYAVLKDEYNTIKESRRECFSMVQQVQSEIEPLEAKRRQVEQKTKQASDHRDKLESGYRQALRAMTAKGTAIETADAYSEELRKELNQLQAKLLQRSKVIANLQRKIADQIELIENTPPTDDIEREKDLLQAEANEHAQTVLELKHKVQGFLQMQEDIARETKKSMAVLQDKRRMLVALDDIRNRRLQELRATDNDVYEAVLWLRENQGKFQKQVFEPVCLEINITRLKYVDAIENIIGGQLKNIVCQTRDDYDTVTRELLDRKKLRVNVIAPKGSDLDFQNYRSPASREELHRYGFECYVVDALEGPSALLATLCSKAGIHSVPLSDAPNLDLKAVRESRLFRKFSTLQEACTVSYSKYSGEPIQTSTPLRRARLLTASVDQQERDKLIHEVDNLQNSQTESEEQIRRILKDEEQARMAHEVAVELKDKVAAKRKDLMMKLKRIEKQKIELDQLKSDLARKERDPSSEEQEGRIESRLQSLAGKRCKLALDYLEAAKESSRRLSVLTVATLLRLQLQAELQIAESDCRDKDRQIKEITHRYEEVNRQFEDIKAQAKEMLDRAKTEYNTLEPEDVPDFQEIGKDRSLEDLEDQLAREKAKSELHLSTNKSVIDKYEQRQNEIKAARIKAESKQKKLDKIAADLEAVRGPWYTAISALIAKISKEFSTAFGKIGCAGEVRLGENEDYDKWSIDIMVKFRDSEKLQKLTGQRQSGGERSVSTIMYLMALQELSKVSFRVVDEINQGMDPRNERLVHTQLVEKACKKGTAQYFLITPKLLPNLEYHERMKVLCIYNGEWLDDGVLKWGKYINNQNRANAAKRMR
ncbi:Structural maintenance of chromosomes protein 5 [Podila humilis]|nr:Structural maintenance of chromosomes protein 5 [Podila humilis]